ncbi:MAG TPA: hypothetical protein VE954_03945 [Oligoflexus sp.]|nr:hypothetical protein [Oligoflexus sp.]
MAAIPLSPNTCHLPTLLTRNGRRTESSDRSPILASPRSASANATQPGKVLIGTAYGTGGNGSAGTLTLPSAANVLTGSGTYGDPGSALTPSYGPDFPSAGNVLSTDTVNGTTGTLTLPSAGNVLTGSGAYGPGSHARAEGARSNSPCPTAHG